MKRLITTIITLAALGVAGAAAQPIGITRGTIGPINVYCLTDPALTHTGLDLRCGRSTVSLIWPTHGSAGTPSSYYLVVDLPAYDPTGPERFRVFAEPVYRFRGSHLGWHICPDPATSADHCGLRVSPKFAPAQRLGSVVLDLGHGYTRVTSTGLTEAVSGTDPPSLEAVAGGGTVAGSRTDLEYALLVTVLDWRNRRFGWTVIPQP